MCEASFIFHATIYAITSFYRFYCLPSCHSFRYSCLIYDYLTGAQNTRGKNKICSCGMWMVLGSLIIICKECEGTSHHAYYMNYTEELPTVFFFARALLKVFQIFRNFHFVIYLAFHAKIDNFPKLRLNSLPLNPRHNPIIIYFFEECTQHVDINVRTKTARNAYHSLTFA